MQLYSETVFEVRGQDGFVRRGILCSPNITSDIAIVLVPAGLKYHVGPHRFYVDIARALAAIGYTVLRFDPKGLGESDGDIAAAPTRDVMSTIEQGLFVDDLLLVSRHLREHEQFKTIIAGGLCGGAMTAQLAAAREREIIDGLISISPPSTIFSNEAPAAATMNAAVAHHHFQNYLRKLFSPLAWKRILQGQSDFASIAKTVKTVVSKKKKPMVSATTAVAAEHKLFMDSFVQLNSMKIPQLLIFGGNDNRWLEFEQGILHPYLNSVMQDKFYDIHVIANANHELFWREWWQAAIAQMQAWLMQKFPVAVPSSTQQQGAA